MEQKIYICLCSQVAAAAEESVVTLPKCSEASNVPMSVCVCLFDLYSTGKSCLAYKR